MSANVLRIPKRVFRRREAERLRDMIPVDTYFAILDHAALTGEMPILDPQTRRPRFKPDGEYLTEEITTTERRDIMKYLTDKRLPSIKTVAITDAGAKEEFEVDAAIEAQSTDALRKLMAPDAQDSEQGLENPWDEDDEDVA